MRTATAVVTLTFAGWMQQVDDYLSRRYLVASKFLPDFDYFAYFDGGESPELAAEHAINAHVPF